MARRRHSPVPVFEWRKAFAEIQHNMAMAIRNLTLSPEEESKVPKYALAIRLALNRLMLSSLRNALAQVPGIENAPQLKAAFVAIAETVLDHWDKYAPQLADILKAVLVRQGVNPEEVDLNEYLKLAKETLAKTVEYVKSGLTGNELTEAAIKAIKAAMGGAAPVAAPAA